jgi:hypothetical protein
MTTHERDQQKLQLEQKNKRREHQLREKDRVISHLMAYIEYLHADQDELIHELIGLREQKQTNKQTNERNI